VLIDAPVEVETDPATGRPILLTPEAGRPYRVRKVMGEWQEPGEARLFRLQASEADGPMVVAEIVGPEVEGSPWRLRYLWR
jgi:hypothetical protein